MSLTLQLSPEAERALQQEASFAGILPADYAQRLIYRGLHLPEVTGWEGQTLTELFSEWKMQENDIITSEVEDQDWDEIANRIDADRVHLPVPKIDDHA